MLGKNLPFYELRVNSFPHEEIKKEILTSDALKSKHTSNYFQCIRR